MLSMKSKYALKALLAFARHDSREPLQAGVVADQENIPRKFLELILADLKHAGILLGRKGRGGGYLLARSPDSISIGEVIRHLDGPLALIPCVSRTAYHPCEDCPDEISCGVNLIMGEVRDTTAQLLDGTTLGELIRKVDLRKNPNSGMYYI